MTLGLEQEMHSTLSRRRDEILGRMRSLSYSFHESPLSEANDFRDKMLLYIDFQEEVFEWMLPDTLQLDNKPGIFDSYQIKEKEWIRDLKILGDQIDQILKEG